MEDLTLRYYDAEMRYLREAAKEFARTHPDRAAMLDLDKAGTPDPYVERLFEGFAFSMGRLRERLTTICRNLPKVWSVCSGLTTCVPFRHSRWWRSRLCFRP
jgi:hypothetical protein